jgi:hypothetical protein
MFVGDVVGSVSEADLLQPKQKAIRDKPIKILANFIIRILLVRVRFVLPASSILLVLEHDWMKARLIHPRTRYWSKINRIISSWSLLGL